MPTLTFFFSSQCCTRFFKWGEHVWRSVFFPLCHQQTENQLLLLASVILSFVFIVYLTNSFNPPLACLVGSGWYLRAKYWPQFLNQNFSGYTKYYTHLSFCFIAVAFFLHSGYTDKSLCIYITSCQISKNRNPLIIAFTWVNLLVGV